MGRYRGPKEKIERRIGEKLGLKGERSKSQKSSIVKKPYPPGMHGKKRPSKLSEFGTQLRSKQKVRNIYRILEKQFKRSVKSALTSKNDPHLSIAQKLERRLDNAVYRLGFAQSRDQARQLVNHGHILVNGRRLDIASHEVKVGDVIQVRPSSQRSPYFSTMVSQWMKDLEIPPWLELDKNNQVGKIKTYPSIEESGLKPDDLQAIIELYSR